MRIEPKTTFLAALLVAGLAGLGVASAQLIPGNRAMGATAEANSDGSECASGIAIDATFSMFCSDYCTEDADCPTAWGCRSIRQGGGETVGICFPYRIVANP